MNLNEIIRAVQRQFGDEAEAQITRADIILWANTAQVDIAKKTDALQQHAVTHAIQADGSYVLPNNFLQMRKASYNGQKLVGTALEEIDRVSPNSAERAAGTPTHFYVWGQNIWLYPAPDTAGENALAIFYTRMPAPLVNGVDVPEIPLYMHEDIVRFCLARAKELDEAAEQAATIMADYELRVAENRASVSDPVVESYPSVRLLAGDE